MKWVVWIGLGLVVLIGVIAVLGALAPRAHTATRKARFRASAEDVFKLISTPGIAAEWRSDVESVEVLEAGASVRFREVWKDGTKILFERVEYDPPRRMLTRIADPELPFQGTWTYELQAAADGCELRITENGEVGNIFMRFFSAYVMSHTKSLEGYLRDAGKRLGETVQVGE